MRGPATGEAQKPVSILVHLAELRKRLLRSVIVVAIATVLAFVFYHQIFDILLYPAGEMDLIFVEMTEMIGTIFRVCLAVGIMLAVPYLTYEFIMFVSPALTSREKRYVYFILPWIAIMFAAGVVFGYFILTPPAIKFLLGFGGDIADAQIRIGNYIPVVTKLLLVTGLIFEVPVLTTFLARIGVVSGNWLASKRKIVIVGAFLLAAILTPPDILTQIMLGLPLIALYELSIWLARLVGKKRQSAQA
ncbi:MAG: twin-arginine translocase subunit TatC [Dehalococcoidia bacterium]